MDAKRLGTVLSQNKPVLGHNTHFKGTGICITTVCTDFIKCVALLVVYISELLPPFLQPSKVSQSENVNGINVILNMCHN